MHCTVKYNVEIEGLPSNKWSAAGLLFPTRSSAERERRAAVKNGMPAKITEVLVRA